MVNYLQRFLNGSVLSPVLFAIVMGDSPEPLELESTHTVFVDLMWTEPISFA